MCVNSTLLAAGAAGSSELLAAYHSGSLGISLSIAGFLVGYLAGVVYMLAELGIVDGSTKIAGASSGALLSMAHCSGLNQGQFMDIVQQLSRDCRAQVNCQGRLGAVVHSTLQRVVPRDAHTRCANRAFFSISTGHIDPAPQNLLVGTFSSNDDLVNAACASAFIPAWSGPSGATEFRGQRAFDGVFSNAQPCPPGVRHCIKISSRSPPWSVKQPAIINAISRAVSAGPLKPARYVTSPAAGYARVAALPAGDASGALAKAAGLGVDIAPGVFSELGMSQDAWDELLVMPGDPALHSHLFELGQRDAKAWVQATGLAAAAAARKQGC